LKRIIGKLRIRMDIQRNVMVKRFVGISKLRFKRRKVVVKLRGMITIIIVVIGIIIVVVVGILLGRY
jgi:hypothetical protein